MGAGRAAHRSNPTFRRTCVFPVQRDDVLYASDAWCASCVYAGGHVFWLERRFCCAGALDSRAERHGYVWSRLVPVRTVVAGFHRWICICIQSLANALHAVCASGRILVDAVGNSVLVLVRKETSVVEIFLLLEVLLLVVEVVHLELVGC